MADPRRTVRVRARQAALGLWWRHRGTLLVAAANLFVAAALALTTALLGLVLEDALPVSGHRQVLPWRAFWLAAALLGLFMAILWRGSVHRRTGTLFYVRLIDETWPDWHATPVWVASRRRMSLRSVTRWVDLPDRTRDGVIDLVDVCAKVAAALEAVVNSDRDDTAYTIAPNMLWQPALAIGAELPIVDGLRLLELSGLPDGTGQGVTEISFRPPQPSAGDAPLPSPVSRRSAGARVGLLLVFTGRGLDPDTVFDGMGVGEYYELQPASLGVNPARRTGAILTAAELAKLAAALPAAVAEIKRAAGERELVVAAAMPKTLAMALGWGLAQDTCRFFTNTHLLHHDVETGRYVPVRVHPAQPTLTPTGAVH
jgi:hypothetical protein